MDGCRDRPGRGGHGVGLTITLLHCGPVAFLGSTKALPLLIVAYYSTPFLLTIAANRNHMSILCLCWVYLTHGLVILGRLTLKRTRPRP